VNPAFYDYSVVGSGLFVGYRNDSILRIHDLPAAPAIDPSVGPDELAAPPARLRPSLATLGDNGISEEADVDIIGQARRVCWGGGQTVSFRVAGLESG
jgi:hypothetical protein